MTPDFDLKQYLEARRLMVEEALEVALPQQDGPETRVVEAMRYSLFAGGKRLRPILCLAASEAVGGDLKTAMPAGCALEMIHTYSLIHDDLPAMDDDDLRRGKPTNHKVFGEAIAILAGDGLLTEAFVLLSDYNSLLPERAVQVIGVIAEAASYRGMVGGQVVDILSQNKRADLETVQQMHSRKTAALIAAATESGALTGKGSEAQVAALARYGRAIGLAFQIADDILDIEGDTELLGKTTGADEARGKVTYPAAVGLERSRQTANEMVNDALAALEGFDDRANPLRSLANYIITRKK
ncbi:MAG: polyprenyl synthetase family protein [Deltaproteobacteria bacterium]|jgi:geranylgeranyl diphosphate synthase type II|nr:polyprenyl synthetase family protein [Deltaproteobacteria bacterium]PNV85215.1 MAG: polyprenyl synthetase [Desulfobacteraceae bacterium]MDH3800573.1 polyprenyl synthetase family protein [Deltaproteobacteria bacterium]MDH3849821.1 polyprenyl synthetase family protein [Deltaproteobacteria bacterium]MDH3896328.1 polyprenyl synthetase family protein [Deltaproteobacteria bacterium]